jgi:hypothetical protein
MSIGISSTGIETPAWVQRRRSALIQRNAVAQTPGGDA